MATGENVSITLPSDLAAQMRKAVEAGEYVSSSEVVRDALRDWSHHRKLQQNGVAELQRLWQQAHEDNTLGVDADSVLDGLERKYQAMADASGVRAPDAG